MKKGLRNMALAGLALTLALTASGCRENTKAEKNAGDGKIPETLKIFAIQNSLAAQAGAEDRNGILAYQLMEEKTGCHVEWINPSPVAAQEQFNLMIASGEYPDIIEYYWQDIEGGAQQYVDDGVLVSISDYIDNMPNFKKFNKENPLIAAQYQDVDGNMIYAPCIRKDDELRVYLGPMIRQDWLDKLGLKMPTTTDELYNVLKAFKTGDPNGNGKADEIPFTGIDANSITYGISNIVWAFDTHYDFYVKDGKVTHGIMENNFKEALKYMNKLFAEGLIDPDYMINDEQKYDSKVINDKSGFYFGVQPSFYYNNMNPEKQHVVAVPYIGGKCNNPAYLSNLCGNGAAITTACINPSGAAKWLDEFYSEEGTTIANFGKEGKTYNVVDGKKVLDREYVFNNPEGLERKNVCAKSFIGATTDFPCFQLWDYYSQTLEKWGTDAIEVWYKSGDTSSALPVLQFTSDENRELSKIQSDINTYLSEFVNNVIVGRVSADTFEKAQSTVVGMGMDKVLKIYNDAYSRYLKVK